MLVSRLAVTHPSILRGSVDDQQREHEKQWWVRGTPELSVSSARLQSHLDWKLLVCEAFSLSALHLSSLLPKDLFSCAASLSSRWAGKRYAWRREWQKAGVREEHHQRHLLLLEIRGDTDRAKRLCCRGIVGFVGRERATARAKSPCCRRRQEHHSSFTRLAGTSSS